MEQFSTHIPVSVETLGRVCENANHAAIPTSVWKYVVKDGVETPYIRRSHGRFASNIVDDLSKRMNRLIDEYITLGVPFKYEVQYHRLVPRLNPAECPEYHHIACYAVTGGSEGHYIHIDLVLNSEGGDSVEHRSVNLALIKTFKGMKHAQRIAARAAELLGA